jgi:hypothetical protein
MVRSQYMTGSKRIVAVGSSSAVGVRADDRPAGVAHAVDRLIRAQDDVAICGTEIIPLPNHDWSQPTVGVLRCAECASLAG